MRTNLDNMKRFLDANNVPCIATPAENECVDDAIYFPGRDDLELQIAPTGVGMNVYFNVGTPDLEVETIMISNREHLLKVVKFVLENPCKLPVEVL
jgi:hypothetical protein